MPIQTVETPAEAEARIRQLKEEQAAEKAAQEASAPAFPISPIPDLRGDPTVGRNRPPASAMNYPATPPNVMAKEALDFVERSPLGVAAAERRKEDEKRAKESEVNLSPEFSGMDAQGKKSLPTAADRIREMNMPSAAEQPQGGLRSDGMVNFKTPSGTKMIGQPGPITFAKPPEGAPTAQESVQQQLSDMTPRELEFANAQKQPAFDEDGGQLPASQSKADPNAPEGTPYDHLQNYNKPKTASWRHYLNALESGVGSTYGGEKVVENEGTPDERVHYTPTEEGYQEFVNDMTGGDETGFAEEQFIPQTSRGAADPKNSGQTKSGAVRGEKVDRADEIAQRRGARSDDVTEGLSGFTGGKAEFNPKYLFAEERGIPIEDSSEAWEKATPAEKAKYNAMAVAYNENAGELRDESFAYRAHQMGKDNTDQASANQDVRNLDRMTARGDDERAEAEARFEGKSGIDAENTANERGDHVIGGMGGGYKNRLNPNTGEYEMQKTNAREDLDHQRRLRRMLKTERDNNPTQFLNRDGTVNNAAVDEWWEAHGGTDKVPSDWVNEGLTDDEGNEINTEGQNIAATPYGSLGMDTKSRFAHRLKDMAQRKSRVQDVALGYSPAGAKYNADIQDMINNGEWEQAAALAGRVGDEKTSEYLLQKKLSENKILEADVANKPKPVNPGDLPDTPQETSFKGMIDYLAGGGMAGSPEFNQMVQQHIMADMETFENSMLQKQIPTSSSVYQDELANFLTKDGSKFNQMLNTMFTQADPQPYEQGWVDRISNWISGGQGLSPDQLDENRLPMKEFINNILGSIGMNGAVENPALRQHVGRMYLTRMAHRFPELMKLKEEYEATHSDKWSGQGFIMDEQPSGPAESGEQKGAEASAPPPPAAEQKPAAEQEEAPPQQEEGIPPSSEGGPKVGEKGRDWHKREPKKSGSESVQGIRDRIKERNASKPGSRRRSQNKPTKETVPAKLKPELPNPSLWE